MTTTLFPRAGYSAQARREFTRVVAAAAAVFETVFEVLAQAERQSSAARSRFPLAD